jgi:hypothetical protein
MKKEYTAPLSTIIMLTENARLLSGSTKASTTMGDGSQGPSTGDNLIGGDQRTAGSKSDSWNVWDE